MLSQYYLLTYSYVLYLKKTKLLKIVREKYLNSMVSYSSLLAVHLSNRNCTFNLNPDILF